MSKTVLMMESENFDDPNNSISIRRKRSCIELGAFKPFTHTKSNWRCEVVTLADSRLKSINKSSIQRRKRGSCSLIWYSQKDRQNAKNYWQNLKYTVKRRHTYSLISYYNTQTRNKYTCCNFCKENWTLSWK